MRKNLLLLLLLALFQTSFSEELIGTFKTYDDYINNSMDTMDSYVGFSHSNGAMTIRFKKGGIEKKVKCRDMWGFKIGDRLFRIDQKFEQPACVLYVGKIIYYENGAAYLDGIKTKRSIGEFTLGYLCYFSTTINSEIVPYEPKAPEAKKRMKEFKKAYPQYAALFKCLGKTESYEVIRPCVKNFNTVVVEEN